MLLAASKLQCLNEVLSIVSLLSVPNIFFCPFNKRDQVAEEKKKFISWEGDHLTLLNVYRSYKSHKVSWLVAYIYIILFRFDWYEFMYIIIL